MKTRVGRWKMGGWFIVGSRYQATSPPTVRYQLQLIWYAGAGLADSSSGCLAVSRRRCCLPARPQRAAGMRNR